MPPKRKRVEPKEHEDEHRTPTYASEVEWLACLTDPSREVVVNEEVADGKTNTALITEACKLTYILYHNIQAQDCLPAILQSLNKSGTEDDAELTRVVKSTQSAWKAHVVNKFLLPHVKEIVRKWCVAHPYANFGSLPMSERVKMWFEAYDADPKGIVTLMWKPLIKVLDLASIFRTDLPSEDNAKAKAVRQMLRQKYFFGCECTYKYSVADQKKASSGKTLEDWALYAEFGDYASSIVPFADLLVSPKLLALASSESPAKKTKVALAEDFLESASLSSTFDRSDAATVASATSDLISGERHKMGELSSFLSSLSNSRTTSVAPTPPVIEKQEEYTEPSPSLHHLIKRPSPDTGLKRQSGQKSSSLDEFFARKDRLPVFLSAPIPTPPPAAPMNEEDRRFNEFFGIPIEASLTSTMASEDSSSEVAPEPELDEDLL
ncbi:hypothetical protein P171DRAFT_484828 [Karstenula rhodostoma CBS 690.94]|uniref:Uncharacterized protein n=1 Tax=Karstenula rhodostoma CBS 690.94 TaxID=1392251 RepID=A0A9P4PIE4_9PLEO|nr:hypothetical protein P171DRAFT_484828 [Karstenula rhodostoma CBS 690.94]